MPHKSTLITNSIICLTLFTLAFFVFNLPLSNTYLSITAPLYNGDRDENKVAFVFVLDDNSYADNIEHISSSLTTANAKATFFLSGTFIPSNLELVKNLGTEFELGNYGFSNTNLNITDKSKIINEITLCGDLVKSVSDKNMQYFSPPNALYNNSTLGVAESLGYKTILPTNRKTSIDWQTADTNIVTSYATYNTKGGDIIFLTPTLATTQAISKIISSFLERDLTITSVGELFMN